MTHYFCVTNCACDNKFLLVTWLPFKLLVLCYSDVTDQKRFTQNGFLCHWTHFGLKCTNRIDVVVDSPGSSRVCISVLSASNKKTEEKYLLQIKLQTNSNSFNSFNGACTVLNLNDYI